MVSIRSNDYPLTTHSTIRKFKRSNREPIRQLKQESITKREPFLEIMPPQQHPSQQIPSHPSSITPPANHSFPNNENITAPTNPIEPKAPNTENAGGPSNVQVQQLLHFFRQAANTNSNQGNLPQSNRSDLSVANFHNQSAPTGIQVPTMPQTPFPSGNSFPQQMVQPQLPPNPYPGYFLNQGQLSNSYGSLPVPNSSPNSMTAPCGNFSGYPNNQLANAGQTGMVYRNTNRDLPNDVYMRKLGDQKFRVIQSIHGVIDKNILIIVDKLFKGKLLSDEELGNILKEEQENDGGGYFLSPRRSPVTKRYRYGGYNYKG